MGESDSGALAGCMGCLVEIATRGTANMTMAAWSRLPAELRGLSQWVIAGPDKIPLSVDSQGQLYAASSIDPSQWLSFEAATYYAAQYGHGIGFMLSKDDPFACIDFDVCDIDSQRRKGQPIDESKWTTQAQFNWFWEVAQRFDSYTEVSMWGKGLHIWVRGKLPGTGKGVRNGSIELYSQERYLICTGNVVIDKEIRDRHEWLLDMATRLSVDEHGGQKDSTFQLVELPQTLEDEAVMRMAWEADNKFNFQELWAGRWQQFGHPSQSEADMALMSMLTFYSKSNDQCRRLFRLSMLGRREKSVKNDRYLNFTLSAIRAREAREQRVDSAGIAEFAKTFAQLQRDVNAGHTLHVPEQATGQPQPSNVAVSLSLASPVSPAVAKASGDGLPWPPGLAGAIAQFIYDSAPRPVKEVAIVGALGLLAGICGKTWFIPGSGLNLYVILVARSAVGKEAMHSGISALVQAASMRAPSVHGFVNFTDFASGPALIKACATQPSFVQVAGEWGHKLKRLAQDNGADTAAASLRMVMTNLYQKSGPQSIVGGINYSQAEGNIASISGVAFSMIGETTPKTFYSALTETMMEDGFLSRFTIVEYEGDRPPLNTCPQSAPSKALADALGNLVNTAQTPNRIPVNASAGAAQLFHEFEMECDTEINSTKDESWRQMWNRASLKVMRISALLAVADNDTHPCVEPHHVLWALDLIRRDIGIMKSRLESGEIGSDDTARERRAMAVIKDYFQRDITESYGIPPAMRDNGIIPHKIVQIRCQRSPAFVSHRAGSTEAVKQVMKSLVESGYLMEVQKDKMVDAYSFHGKCYRLLNLPDFDKQRQRA
jgi:hypothetical protein